MLQFFYQRTRLVKIPTVFDEFRPLSPHEGIFLGVIAYRYYDGRGDVVHLRCECYGLAVVPACGRDHPRDSLACQMCHEVEPAADFEGANGRVVFVFDIGLKPHFLGEQRVMNQGCRAHMLVHNRLSSFHLG